MITEDSISDNPEEKTNTEEVLTVNTAEKSTEIPHENSEAIPEVENTCLLYTSRCV